MPSAVTAPLAASPSTAVLPQPELVRLSTRIQRLSGALVTAERYLPGVSAYRAPTAKELQRLCDGICFDLDEMLLETWQARDVHQTVRSLQKLIGQLGSLDAFAGLEARLIARLKPRLDELERMEKLANPCPAPGRREDSSGRGVVADVYVHPFSDLEVVKRETCLFSDLAPSIAEPVAPSGRRYTGLALGRSSMVMIGSGRGLKAGCMLPAVDDRDRLVSVQAIGFAASTAAAARQAPRAVTLEDAYRVVGVTQFVRSVIEDAPAFDHPVWHNLLPRLGHFVRNRSAYKVLDAALCLRTHQLFFATNYRTGTLEALHQSLPYSDRMRGALVWSVAAQSFVQLARMHTQAKYGHFNLSTQSIVFGAHGAFDLAGFDEARALDVATAVRPLLVGRIAAPEMVEQGSELSAKVDVFALASIIAQVAGPARDRSNPFEVPLHADQEAQLANGTNSAMVHRFELFKQWKMGLRCQAGDTVSCAAVARDRSPFGLFFAPLAQVAPALCDVLLNDALTEYVWHRKEALLIARAVLDRYASPQGDNHNHNHDMLMGAMKQLEAEVEVPTVKKEAQVYRLWQQGLSQNP